MMLDTSERGMSFPSYPKKSLPCPTEASMSESICYLVRPPMLAWWTLEFWICCWLLQHLFHSILEQSVMAGAWSHPLVLELFAFKLGSPFWLSASTVRARLLPWPLFPKQNVPRQGFETQDGARMPDGRDMAPWPHAAQCSTKITIKIAFSPESRAGLRPRRLAKCTSKPGRPVGSRYFGCTGSVLLQRSCESQPEVSLGAWWFWWLGVLA